MWVRAAVRELIAMLFWGAIVGGMTGILLAHWFGII